MISKKGHLMPKEMGRFIIGGLMSSMVCYGVLYTLVEMLGLHYLIGANIATIVTFIFSYMVNKYVVFKDNSRQHVRQGISFVILQVLLILLANCTLIVGVEIIGLNYFVVVIFLGPTVEIINYLAQKNVIFKYVT
jgi:putative flippase GtrA